MANCEHSRFDLLSGKIASVFAGRQSGQSQSQRKKVEELLIFSLNVAGICHGVFPGLKSSNDNGPGEQFAKPVDELYRINRFSVAPCTV